MPAKRKSSFGLSRGACWILLGGLAALPIGMGLDVAWIRFKDYRASPGPAELENLFWKEFDRNPQDHPWAGEYERGTDRLWITPTRWSRSFSVGDILDRPSEPQQLVSAGDHLRLLGEARRSMEDADIRDLVVVRWSGRVYLVPGQWLGDFVSAVNAGVEPDGRDSIWFPVAYLRKGDEKKPVRGKPELPPSFLSKLLDHEVTAKIVRAERAKGKYGVFTWIKLDAGQSQGVFVGTNFYPHDTGHDGSARVIAVSKSTALAAYSGNSIARVGWTLGTLAPKPRR